MDRLSLEAELIADITALKLVLQHTLGMVGFLSGEHANQNLETLRQGSLASLNEHKLQAPGIPTESLKARSEFTVNQIFDNVRVSFEG